MTARAAHSDPAERTAPMSGDIGQIEVSLATGRGGNRNDSAFLIASGSEDFLSAVAPVSDITGIGAIAEPFLQRLSPAAGPDWNPVLTAVPPDLNC